LCAVWPPMIRRPLEYGLLKPRLPRRLVLARIFFGVPTKHPGRAGEGVWRGRWHEGGGGLSAGARPTGTGKIPVRLFLARLRAQTSKGGAFRRDHAAGADHGIVVCPVVAASRLGTEWTSSARSALAHAARESIYAIETGGVGRSARLVVALMRVWAPPGDTVAGRMRARDEGGEGQTAYRSVDHALIGRCTLCWVSKCGASRRCLPTAVHR